VLNQRWSVRSLDGKFGSPIKLGRSLPPTFVCADELTIVNAPPVE